MRRTVTIVTIAGLLITIGFAMAYSRIDHVRYWTLDVANKSSVRVLAIGSSSIRALPHDYFTACTGLAKRGFAGGTVADIHRYLDFSIVGEEVVTVLVYAGENDIVYGDSPDSTFREFDDLTSRLIDRFPNASIYIIAPKLSPARSEFHPALEALNRQLGDLERRSQITVLESRLSRQVLPQYYLVDGIHLTRPGYDAFLQGIPTSC